MSDLIQKLVPGRNELLMSLDVDKFIALQFKCDPEVRILSMFWGSDNLMPNEPTTDGIRVGDLNYGKLYFTDVVKGHPALDFTLVVHAPKECTLQVFTVPSFFPRELGEEPEVQKFKCRDWSYPASEREVESVDADHAPGEYARLAMCPGAEVGAFSFYEVWNVNAWDLWRVELSRKSPVLAFRPRKVTIQEMKAELQKTRKVES